jgi:hypothetical protein
MASLTRSRKPANNYAADIPITISNCAGLAWMQTLAIVLLALAATAQGIYSGVAVGMMTATMTLVSGPLYGASGPGVLVHGAALRSCLGRLPPRYAGSRSLHFGQIRSSRRLRSRRPARIPELWWGPSRKEAISCSAWTRIATLAARAAVSLISREAIESWNALAGSLVIEIMLQFGAMLGDRPHALQQLVSRSFGERNADLNMEVLVQSNGFSLLAQLRVYFQDLPARTWSGSTLPCSARPPSRSTWQPMC